MTLEEMRKNLADIKDQFPDAINSVYTRVGVTPMYIRNEPTFNNCVTVTNTEVGNFLKGAGEFLNASGADLRVIFGKHIYDLAKAANNKFDKNDCNQFAVEQAKKIIENVTKMALANHLNR